MKTHFTIKFANTITMLISNVGITLRNIMERISNINYYCNEATRSGAVHSISVNRENGIEQIFTDNGVILRNIMEEISNMKYYCNEPARSGAVHGIVNHENAIEQIFTNNGISKSTQWYETSLTNILENRNKLNKWINNGTCDGEDGLLDVITPGTYLSQPFGTHDNPDFIIRDARGKLFAIEAKSTKTSLSPMYNSGGIKHNFIYVFTNKKMNETSVYLGRDIMTIEQQQLLTAHIERARKQDDEFNTRMKNNDTNNRGITFYTRPMIQQTGGAEKTNYFKHENRIRDKNNVLEFVSPKH
jgi:hypothetical protein